MRRCCCRTLTFMILALTMLSGTALSSPDVLATPRTGELPWGLYKILWSGSHVGPSLDRNAEVLGGPPRFVRFFRDLGRPFPAEVCREITERGAIPVISVELVHWGGRSTGLLDAINSGQYDDLFGAYALPGLSSGWPPHPSSP